MADHPNFIYISQTVISFYNTKDMPEYIPVYIKYVYVYIYIHICDK